MRFFILIILTVNTLIVLSQSKSSKSYFLKVEDSVSFFQVANSEEYPTNQILNENLINSKIDSIIYEDRSELKELANKEKYIYRYNENNLLTTKETHAWIYNDSIWSFYLKEEYQYNSTGYELVYTSSIKISEEAWRNDKKIERKYNVFDLLIEKIEYYWLPNSSEWENGLKTEYTYDSRGNLTLLETYRWSLSNEDWNPGSKHEMVFNEDNNEIENISYDFKNGEWVNRYKTEKKYSDTGNVVEKHGFTWNVDLDNWIDASVYKYTSDIKGNETSVEYKMWDDNLKKWTYFQKEEKLYTEENLIYEVYVSGKNSEAEDWYTSVKYEYEYNIDKLTNITKYLYTNGAWAVTLDSSRDAYTYNESSNIVEYTKFRWFNDEWYAMERTTSFSSTYITSLEFVSNQIRIYPNPAAKYLFFDGIEGSKNLNISIFDLNGRQIFTKKIYSNDALDISSLKEGLYLYQILYENNFIAGKVLIKK